MPTKYKPILNHIALEYGAELDAIENHVYSCCIAIRDILVARGVPAETIELEVLVEQLIQILCQFAMNCDALPPKTPRKLLATIERIGKNPSEFLVKSDGYDPEAKERVLGAYAGMSPSNRQSVYKFELGNTDGMSENQLVEASRLAAEVLQKDALERKKGGPLKLDGQTSLAVDLASFFLSKGGSIARTVADGETGPFHQFLELVLPAVRPFARRANFALTVTTMVAKARKELIPKPQEVSGS